MIEKLKIEISLWQKNVNFVAGVDEVGRGCFAGPLVTSAVVWSSSITSKTNSNKYNLLNQINDSKKVSKTKRDYLSEFIKENCLEYAIYEVDNKEIDRNGVGEANKKATVQVINKLKNVEYVLTDFFDISAVFNRYSLKKDQNNKLSFLAIKNGDSLSLSIAAASIVAKVYRDKLMATTYHIKFPQYSFDKHVGYGTKLHIENIKKHGISDIHRLSFLKNVEV